MRIKFIGIILCLLVILPVFSLTAGADPETELKIKIMGGLPVPIFFHYLGGVIVNTGNTSAYNVSYKLSITGGFLGGVEKTSEGYEDEILPDTGLGIPMTDVFGFGPVTITMTASASNAENVTGLAKGIQIGGFTWVPFSWITP